MENLKFILILALSLALLGFGGYWAINTMQSGSDYVKNQKIKELEEENEKLKLSLGNMETENSIANETPKIETPTPAPTPAPVVVKPTTPTPTKPTTTTHKHQTLINELQKLADKGAVIEPGDASPAVGSVQKFLNIYNKTSNKVDNDYGASTKTAVIAFQKAQGLTADGGVGKSTFTKMVSWLKKQG